MRTLVHSVRLFGSATVDSDRPDGWALFDGGRVLTVGVGEGRPSADETVDGEKGCLAPGFIDIHGHGGAGASFDDGPEAIRTARAVHRGHGTTRAVLSLITASIDDLAQRIAMVADLTDAN